MTITTSPSPTLAMPAPVRITADAIGAPDPTFGVSLVFYRGEPVGVIGARATHHTLTGEPAAFVWEV